MSASIAKVNNHQVLSKKRKSCFEITNVAFQTQSDDESGEENNLSSNCTEFEEQEEKDSNGFNCSMIVSDKNNHIPSTNNIPVKSRFKIFKSKVIKGRWKCFDFVDNESFHASYSIGSLNQDQANEAINTNGSSASITLLPTSNVNTMSNSIQSVSSNSRLTTCTSSAQLNSSVISDDFKMTNEIKDTLYEKDLVDHSNNGLNYPNPSYQLLYPIVKETLYLQSNDLNQDCVHAQNKNIQNLLHSNSNEVNPESKLIQRGNVVGSSSLDNIENLPSSYALPINSQSQILNINPRAVEMPLLPNDVLNNQSNHHVPEYNEYNEVNTPLVNLDSPVHYEISEKISQALDLAKEHLIIATNKTIENLRMKITSLQSTVQLLEEENRQLRNSNNLSKLHQQTLTTPVVVSHEVPVGDLIDFSDF